MFISFILPFFLLSFPFSLFVFFSFFEISNSMSATLWFVVCTIALVSANSFRKQKITSTLTSSLMKNSTLAKQHMVHGTRYISFYILCTYSTITLLPPTQNVKDLSSIVKYSFSLKSNFWIFFFENLPSLFGLFFFFFCFLCF